MSKLSQWLKQVSYYSRENTMLCRKRKYQHFTKLTWQQIYFSGGAVVKSLPANAGGSREAGSIAGSGRPRGVGNGKPLQYSCLENAMDRGAGRATVPGVAKSRTQPREWASTRHSRNKANNEYRSNQSDSHTEADDPEASVGVWLAEYRYVL